ncbi:MAG: GNAT family N-acetyltransferase [Erysipelotrichaceae bacterium]|nr:GNAT family N-acetyltransferase [Erysipelotrichaceae bacterium]MDD4642352.1 GNAT family N-acetyltransferase [Erysipelotrichaceae bacterium]
MERPKLNHHGSKRIETKRLILRPLSNKDAYDIFININNDKQVLDYFKAPYYENFNASSIDSLVRLSNDPTSYCWGIELKEIKECIGIFLQQARNDYIGSIEIGYAIGSRYWNQGYVSEAVIAVIKYLFNDINYHKITAGHVIENLASKRVLEKCGLVYEGIRKDDFFHNDRYYDIIHYYIINPNHKQKIVIS